MMGLFIGWRRRVEEGGGGWRRVASEKEAQRHVIKPLVSFKKTHVSPGQ